MKNIARARWLPVGIMIPVIALVNCSPIPLIQSPRVDSKFAINASIKNSGVSNINTAEPDIRSKQRFVTDEKIPVFISIGIRERVELSGVLLPYLVYGLLWQGNVKVALFDLNREKRFGNLAAALFAGSVGYRGEHEDRTNFYGGMSAGSRVPAGPGSLELVVQSSVSYEHETDLENHDWYTIYWVQPALGIVYCPVKRGLMEFSLGCNYSHPLRNHGIYTIYNNYPQPNTVRDLATPGGGFTALAAVRFRLVR